MGLTSGFRMRPGKHHRYDRAPIFSRIGYGCDMCRSNWHELLDEEHSRCGYIRKRCSNISAAGLNTSPRNVLTSAVYHLVFYERSEVSSMGWLQMLSGSYPSGRGYPALPCQTTGKLVAPSPRSSRTKGPFHQTPYDSTTKQQTCLTTV